MIGSAGVWPNAWPASAQGEVRRKWRLVRGMPGYSRGAKEVQHYWNLPRFGYGSSPPMRSLASPLLLVLLLVLVITPRASAQAPLAVDPKEMPRFPAVEPKEAAATFQVRPGFHV